MSNFIIQVSLQNETYFLRMSRVVKHVNYEKQCINLFKKKKLKFKSNWNHLSFI